ncbi:MAG: hypothetical protein GYA65_19260 [Actinobacteria bacterium]|jgi:hypothetical protein|nr:hypothetical protein [Acidimicrobiaceae bacterium]MBP6489012.1 hypothetical protein [Ilumatobacteraceae bacterium]NMD26317.1 hypothetical protein [Actinomycetota bacterium]MBP7890282.1 hypothetical protein [Ilumatobacteraceae bacterium]MBP8209769.1 hypothetical protein [Ilumatobacteraceae bacterium]
MSNEPSTEPANTPEPTSTDTDADVDADEALDLVSYDLNDDGKISPLEGARAELGLVDARLEQLAQEPGVKGKLADAAHHLLDKLDND